MHALLQLSADLAGDGVGKLARRARRAEGAVRTRLDRHVHTKDLVRKGYRYDLNGRRPGRPRGDSDKDSTARSVHHTSLMEKATLQMRNALAQSRQGAEKLEQIEKQISNLLNQASEISLSMRHAVNQARVGSQRLSHLRATELKGKSVAKKKKTTTKKRGRRTVESTGDESVSDLLRALERSEDPDEKRRLRAKLRSRGHTGGLGTGRGRPAGTTSKKKKTTKKKRRRAA